MERQHGPNKPGGADRILSGLRIIARALASDHALALSAAAKAASPRRSLAEVRALYLARAQGGDPHVPVAPKT